MGRDKKNVLLLVDSVSGGGAELVASYLCRNISQDKFNVSICYLKEKGYRGEELESESFNVFGIYDMGTTISKYTTFLLLKKAVRLRAIDIIHSHSTGPLIDACFCRLVYPKVRVVHTFHFGNYPNLKKKYLLMEKIFSKVPDRLVAVGNEQKESIIKTFNIPKDQITTVWNGVEDPKKGVADSNLLESLPKGKAILGSLSTFIPQKGLDYLLDVAVVLKQKRNDFIILIIGDGPLRPDLEKRCNQLNLSDIVFFLGWVKDAPSRILPLFDIFVQSSLWEAMSMVILEAMAAGKPIVATEVGENRHVIKHGASGFLSPPRDISAMAGYVEQLLNNVDIRNGMGLKARETFERDFTVDLMARRYEQVYDEVLGR